MDLDRSDARVGPIGDGQAPLSIDAIPGELRRIADLVEVAVVLGPLNEVTSSFGLPSPTALSARQWEVVRRLIEGERVPTIAAAMFLSRSTVRNHLSAVYAKVGVHSQSELIALYRGPRQVHGGGDR